MKGWAITRRYSGGFSDEINSKLILIVADSGAFESLEMSVVRDGLCGAGTCSMMTTLSIRARAVGLRLRLDERGDNLVSFGFTYVACAGHVMPAVPIRMQLPDGVF